MNDEPQSGPEQQHEAEHVTVLLREAVDLLEPKPGGIYVDGTLGGGGHAASILERSPGSILIGIDQDPEALSRARVRLAPYGERAVLRQGNFRFIEEILAELSRGSVDGILLDLGVSWFHLRNAERGFSFLLDGPLDMRMDPTADTTAADLVNSLPQDELKRILWEYGEENKAPQIVRAIEKARMREPIRTTLQLAGIVSSVFPPYPRQRIHPATRTFQALRIAVNDEIAALRDGLRRMIGLLNPGGRIAVISFHSLEDRVVKQTFVSEAGQCTCPPKLPFCRCGWKAEVKVLTKKPVTAGQEELERNPAARSAKLRAAEKL